MALSEVSVCNQALIWLGGNVITALTDGSAEAIACNAVYDPLRDAVLEDREWTFAVARIQPAALVATPVFGFDKQFQIPSNVIRVLQVSDATAGVIGSSATMQGRYNKVEWLREGDTIVANNVDAIYARVLTRITDVTKFSPAFVQALAARIAMDLAIPITGSRGLQSDMAALYGEKLRMAASTDGLQGRSYITRSNEFTEVR